MSLRDSLLSLLQAPDYVPLRREEILAVLKLDKDGAAKAHRLIDQMLQRGEIARLKKDKLCIPRDADLISGKIIFRQSGSAILVPADNPQGQGYPVSAEDTGIALHGDQVLARINNRPPVHRGRGRAKPDPTAKPNVRVIRILQRAHETFPGTLKKGRHATYVIPDDPRIIQDFLVPDPRNSGIRPIPKEGDKVIVKLVEWQQRHLNPEADIIEVLGQTHEPDAEFKAILHKYDLHPQFPAEVERQTNNIPDHVPEADCAGRKDIREIFTFTIDPDDAKDFDDALSLEELDGGRVRVGIHIADVSAYVKPGSPLDIEAQKRGNSTYLVGTVIPMLPHALSNGLCSLVEAEDRLTKSVFITYTDKAAIEQVEYANTVIRSDKRLTYRQAFAFMTKDDFKEIRKTPLPPKHQTGSTGRPLDEVSDAEMKRLQKHIRKLWDIASLLRTKRFSQGSLDLDMTEIKIYVDEQGYADRIEKQFNDESHQLIEEFMLSANEQVARVMKRENYPCIYRVHDEPEDEKLQELRETMRSFGIRCGNLANTREMSKLLKILKDHPQGYTLKIHVLRSLKQAQYRASSDGHYGLAKSDYTHFTSPIRRYSDLVVHRVFDSYLHKIQADSAPDQPDVRYTQGKLESIADHLCVTERNSVDAERESVKTKLLEYFERELNKDKAERNAFRAVIADVKNHGMFVELVDSQAYGMVHISTLDDDFYLLSNDGQSLFGRRKKRTYSLGQYIDVQVERVDRFKRQIDFRVIPTVEKTASHQRKAPKSAKELNELRKSRRKARKGPAPKAAGKKTARKEKPQPKPAPAKKRASPPAKRRRRRNR
ncbi:MAG: RNB domain-containing ribonuclease [Opitutales bacterium]